MTKRFRELISEVAPVSMADKDFWKIHKIKIIPDRNGNGDSVFKGTIQKDHTRIADKGEVAQQGDGGTTPNHDPDSLPIVSQEAVEGVLGAYDFYLDEGWKDGKYSHPTGKLSPEHRRRVEKALKDTKKFIDKEGPRDPKLRPAHVQKTLDFYHKHAKKLQKALDTNTHDPIYEGLDEDFEYMLENFDQLDELSKDTLKSYVKKANADVRKKRRDAEELATIGTPERWNDKSKAKAFRDASNRRAEQANKRSEKIKKAKSKITEGAFDEITEDEWDILWEDFDQLDELSQGTLKSYILKAYDDNKKNTRAHLDKHDWDAKKLKAAKERGEGDKQRRRADMIAKATSKFYAKRNKK